VLLRGDNIRWIRIARHNVDKLANEIFERNTEDKAVSASSTETQDLWNLDDFSRVEEMYGELVDAGVAETYHSTEKGDLPKEAAVMAGAVELVGRMQKDEVIEGIETYAPQQDDYVVDGEVTDRALEETEEIFSALPNGGAHALNMLQITNGEELDQVYDDLTSMNTDYAPDVERDEFDDKMETLDEYGFVEETAQGMYRTTGKGDSLANLLDTQRTAL
jgi:hypothetical protein